MPRLRSDIWVGAIIRRANGGGAFAAVLARGSDEAGAIFVKVSRPDRTASLYGPAPQSIVGEASGDRLFECILADVPEFEVDERLRRERQFDSDCWQVEIEDRERRDWVEIVRER